MAKSPEQLSVLLGTATLPGLFERLGFTEPYQIEEFYASNFYELLRNPDSGLWHLSSAALADLYRQEVERGFFGDPEEQGNAVSRVRHRALSAGEGADGPGGGGSLSRKGTLAVRAGQLFPLPHRVSRLDGCRH